MKPLLQLSKALMKVFLLALLAALLGVERAHSLVCFCCMNKNSKFYCLKPTICSDQTTTAWSSLHLTASGTAACSPIGPGPSVNLSVASVGTHCCQSFLCNISVTHGGLLASATVLGLGLLLSLLSALLRFGL
uniref:Snake toxin/toxin-like domain-containing protein n=1 Tax=Sus scrofa TaxID=9823 RepID=A0A8D1LQN5_PIG